ncbi:MAG: hypothetical protein ACW99A_09000 [Candidatus Kariarchaeaceae archaeon]|jgi:hypothetical protein
MGEDIKINQILDPVNAKEFNLRLFLTGSKSAILDKIHNHIRKMIGEDMLESKETLMSPSLRGGMNPIFSEKKYEMSLQGWKISTYHPMMQDRSPAIIYFNTEKHQYLVLNIKGGGIRDLQNSFISRSERFQEYQKSINESVLKPVDIHTGRSRDIWSSQKLVGGAQLMTSFIEIWHALGWHHLLLLIDGNIAGTCIPSKLKFPTEFVVRFQRNNELVERKLKLWDYFTNPKIMHKMQLQQVVKDIGNLTSILQPTYFAQKSKFLKIIDEDPMKLLMEENTKLRMNIGNLYLKKRKPVLYEHLTFAKLRIGQIGELLSNDFVMSKSLSELKLKMNSINIKEVIDLIMREIYLSNGYMVNIPVKIPLSNDISFIEDNYAYSGQIYLENKETAEKIILKVGRTAGRSLGALHGSGGHAGGTRIKIQDKKGRPILNQNGFPRRTGAPGGGATAMRNVTVCGELVDLTHVYNPIFDYYPKIIRVMQKFFRSRFKWAENTHIKRLQNIDRKLAKESMITFEAILRGQLNLIPKNSEKINLIKKRRRILEDTLETSVLTTSEIKKLMSKIIDMTKQIRHLRNTTPKFGNNRIIKEFKKAYQIYYQEAENKFGKN